MLIYHNDNSNDIATNIFKPIKVVKSHYYNQLFRRRVLSHTEKFMNNPTPGSYKTLQRALTDYTRYKNNSEVHPLDEEI